MAEIYSFPNNADEYIGAEEVMHWLHGRTSGVYSAGGNAAVTAVQNSMAVSVAPGIGWIADADSNGVCWWFDTAIELEIDAAEASGTLNRIDRIIIEWPTTDYADKPVLKVLKGTSASTASAPALTNNSTKRQISLARVSIPAGTTELTAALITDERLDPSVCGLVTESVTADTSMIAAQYNAAVAELQTAIAQAWSGEISDGAISTAKLQDESVSSVKLQDESVSSVKLQDEAVTSDKIADDAVTMDKLSDVKFRIYDSVTQLGLVAGSVTLVGAWQRLPENSILFADKSEFSINQLPPSFKNTTGAYVEIIKRANGSGSTFYRTPQGIDFQCNLSSSGPNPEWEQIAQVSNFFVESVTSGNFPTTGDNKGTVTVNVGREGYRAIGIVGYTMTQSGSSGVYPFRLYLTDSTTAYVAIGPANNSYAGKITLRILYAPVEQY